MVSHRLILKIPFRLKNNWSLTGLLAGAAGAAGLQHQRYWSAAVLFYIFFFLTYSQPGPSFINLFV